MQVPFEASIVSTQAGSGVQSVAPSSGTISLQQPTTFTIRVDPSAAQTGYSTAYLALSQTYPQDPTLTTLMGTVQISHFNFGPTSVNFTSIAPNGDGTANVTAVVAVDFVAPSGVTVPMLGAITTDASNVSTACASTAPSGISGATTSYTCDAAVPIKVSGTCDFAMQQLLPVCFMSGICADHPLQDYSCNLHCHHYERLLISSTSRVTGGSATTAPAPAPCTRVT